MTPTCFNLNFNTLIDRKELRKSERIKKMGMSHLITAKTITSLEPKLSGKLAEVVLYNFVAGHILLKLKAKEL